MKEIRDGEQDYEYFALLARGGHKADADAIVASIVTNDYTFNDSPAALFAAREAAAAAIEALPRGRASAVAAVGLPAGTIISGRP